MNILRILTLISSVFLVLGCGGKMAGTYTADARLIEGKTETADPGYSLTEIRDRLSRENRTLTLQSNGRYIWNTGSAVLEGKWRVEGDTLILRDDISNGNRISSAMQDDRKWIVNVIGETIYSGAYRSYNIEEIYTRQ